MESIRGERRARRSFLREFKAEVVELVRSSGKSVGAVARGLALTETAVRTWVRQTDVDAGDRPGAWQRGPCVAGAAAQGKRGAARRVRHPERSDGFVRRGDPVNVYAVIEAEKAQQRNVPRACALLQVSRSAYYQWVTHIPSVRQRADDALAARIKTIHTTSRGTYGWPRVHRVLRRDDVGVSGKRVARIMREHAVVGRCRRRFTTTTISDPDAGAVDLVKRVFGPGTVELDRVYVGDTTDIRTWPGWLYLATVIDLSSRRVVGWAMADHLRPTLVWDALAMAPAARRPAPGLIFHSDRGTQYTSDQYRRLLDAHGVVQSFSRPRQCWDNAVAESFFATLRTKLIHRQPWATRAQVRRAVFAYLDMFYNRQRLHSSLGYLSPAEYEAAKTQQPTTAQAT